MRITDPSPKSSFYVQSRQTSPTLIIPKAEKFDESAENYIRFVQGANAFIAVKHSFFVCLIYRVSIVLSNVRKRTYLLPSLVTRKRV
jgi:hypothetical protein